ncbi:TetR/AcrR family transcriptional regulator [Streptomyces deccanensis]|uniref:TetR/AcrR family transcriptional regulator n=1 Tax=Streptomyces deccanensis TaxID=424188 RepID=UPI003B849DBA
MSVAGRAGTGGDTCRTRSPGQTGAGYHAQVKKENRARIIRAARDLFLAQGYDKTSLAQIAKGARVSTGTLFKRYRSCGLSGSESVQPRAPNGLGRAGPRRTRPRVATRIVCVVRAREASSLRGPASGYSQG